MDSADKAVSGNALLKLLTRRLSRKKYLGHVVDLFREWSGCSCVGVRILNEDGTIPYEVYKGFTDEFWKIENWLSVNDSQCTCIRVMIGAPKTCDSSAITPSGSFLTNNLAQFIRNLNDSERSYFRGACFKQGFKSMAVLPVRCGNQVVAAIHLADKRKDMLLAEIVAQLESVTPLIGQAIERFGMEDRLKKNYVMQRALNSLMRMSLNNADIGEILNKAIDKVLSMTWLPFEQKGCVFLVKDGAGMIELVSHKNLPEPLLKTCAAVPFGKCFCGGTASEKIAHFYSFNVRDPECHCKEYHHGLYSIPLLNSGRALGVVNFFLKEGYQLNPQHAEFLSTIANALSGIIIRKEAEENLKNSQEQLRRLAVHLQTSREDERTEFAREVHDELGQALTALKMDIYWIRKRLLEREGALVSKIDSSLSLVDATLRSVRRICTELRPDILDHLGIVAAVEWQIGEFRKRTGIKCSVTITPRDMEISRDLSIFLFRIIQEAFTNIIRHSGASEVNFAMERLKGAVSVRIADNGKGIHKRHITGSKSFGILGIKERVRFWNGSFDIDGAPGNGTTLTINIPLAERVGQS